MARISGVDLPREKRIEIGLTYVYGIGRVRASKILEEAGVNPDTRVKDLTDEEVAKIAKVIDADPEHLVEGATLITRTSIIFKGCHCLIGIKGLRTGCSVRKFQTSNIQQIIIHHKCLMMQVPTNSDRPKWSITIITTKFR